MSHTRVYSRLFSVSVGSDSGDELSGFCFSPTGTARRLLDNHQLLFRPRESGFDVYYSSNPDAPDPVLGPIEERIRLSFIMTCGDLGLYGRYEPDLTRETGAQLYLDNLTADGDIQNVGTESLADGDTVQVADAMSAYPEVFTLTVDVSGGSPPSAFRLIDKFGAGTVLATVPIEAVAGAVVGSAKVEMAELDLAPGPYVLDTEPAGTPRTIYIDDYVAASGVHGVVDVYWETPQQLAPDGGVQFAIRFEER